MVRPWVQVPSNCIAPKSVVEGVLKSPYGASSWNTALSVLCGGANRLGSYDPSFPTRLPLYTLTGVTYSPLKDAPNSGRGFAADLSGNRLPNAPELTLNIGANYHFDVKDWGGRIRLDYYYQGSSYFRVYNTEYDRLRSWSNFGLSASLENSNGVKVNLYIKNVFDDAPIVDAFTNSDDSMLTTNVFTLDPRIVGFSISASF